MLQDAVLLFEVLVTARNSIMMNCPGCNKLTFTAGGTCSSCGYGVATIAKPSQPLVVVSQVPSPATASSSSAGNSGFCPIHQTPLIGDSGCPICADQNWQPASRDKTSRWGNSKPHRLFELKCFICSKLFFKIKIPHLNSPDLLRSVLNLLKITER